MGYEYRYMIVAVPVSSAWRNVGGRLIEISQQWYDSKYTCITQGHAYIASSIIQLNKWETVEVVTLCRDPYDPNTIIPMG